MKIELDVHTHTIASGHAYGTINEMAKAASEKGLKLLGITEHAKGIPGTCDDIYFMNLKVVPRELYGIRLMLGSEINILDYAGNLSLSKEYFKNLDIRIAGIHDLCYKFGTVQENTSALVNAITNPSIDIISHPDDGNCPVDYERVVWAAKEHHTLLEINNNSQRMKGRKNTAENSIRLLTLCKQYDMPVLVSSDAHFMDDIANLDHVIPLLKEANFPDRLVINNSIDEFTNFLAYNREHEINFS
jgi:putative hydrolase